MMNMNLKSIDQPATLPYMRISLSKITENTAYIVKACKTFGISVAGVTKVCSGSREVALAMEQGGVAYLADSRIENLLEYQDIALPKILLRLPMISQVHDVIRYTDISLNSELATIRALDLAAEKLNKIHKLILMVDLGDLREGIFDTDQFIDHISEILTLSNIELVGIGTNLACYGGVLPTAEKMEILLSLKKKIEDIYEITLPIISGGNSSNFRLIRDGTIPAGINHLRIGESIIFGVIPAWQEIIPEMHQDSIQLCAEIIELQEKPSVPIGRLGVDAFNRKPKFKQKGIRTRAICAIGRQDVNAEDMFPLNQKISIVGQSGDHTIIDVTEAGEEFHIGDKIQFDLNYPGVLKAFTSKYITKIYEN